MTRLPLILLAFILGAAPAFGAGKLEVRFFDVGQGDAALVVTPSGKTVLIDGGPPESAAHLLRRVRSLVKGPIDLVVLSHPHLDHLGGLGRLIQSVGAKAYVDPQFDHPGEGYYALLRLLKKKAVPFRYTADPAQPEVLADLVLDEGVHFTVFWPRVGPDATQVEDYLEGTRSDPNSNSIVAKLVYGRTSFLFTGDAERDTEAHLLRKRHDLRATVLKVAHHGSRHSSTRAFLERVKPQAAIISCGADNEYGHPAKETLQRIDEAGAKVFRTDRDGEVTASSNGMTVTITSVGGPDRPPLVVEGAAASTAEYDDAKTTSAPYVASRRSKVFHTRGCSGAATIKPDNLMVFETWEAAAERLRPAGDCNPARDAVSSVPLPDGRPRKAACPHFMQPGNAGW